MFSANQTAEIVACILSLQKALGKLTNAKNVLLQLAIYSLMFFWHLNKVYVCVCVWLAGSLSVCLSVCLYGNGHHYLLPVHMESRCGTKSTGD